MILLDLNSTQRIVTSSVYEVVRVFLLPHDGDPISFYLNRILSVT